MRQLASVVWLGQPRQLQLCTQTPVARRAWRGVAQWFQMSKTRQKWDSKKLVNLTDHTHTGKSLSEALIIASTNPQYDDNSFIELQVQYIHENSNLKPGENMLCREIVSDIQNNFCTPHFLPMFCKKKSFWQRFTYTFKRTISCFFQNLPNLTILPLSFSPF